MHLPWMLVKYLHSTGDGNCNKNGHHVPDGGDDLLNVGTPLLIDSVLMVVLVMTLAPVSAGANTIALGAGKCY